MNSQIELVSLANTDVDDAPKELRRFDTEARPASSDYLTGFQLFTVIFSLCLATLCVALDQTIIATAIPRITDDFKNLNDVGWYGSAYLFTTCAFQLFFGKLYSQYASKWIFLTSLFIFEMGSLICAVSPNSATFIAGRAIAGLGGAGVLSGSLIIIAHSIPLDRRPVFTALINGMFGLTATIGPVIGGALTERVTWRWCFYLNLPIGGFNAVLLLICLRRGRRPTEQASTSISEHILSLDPIGNLLFLPAIICLLLALQWGGTTYAWSDGRVIALLVVAGVLLISFCVSQAALPEKWVTIPPHVIRRRSVAFGAVFAFCLGSGFFIFVYYLPYYFQGIKGASPLQSGVNILPFILAQLVAGIATGALTTQLGHYMPFVLLSIVFMSVGAGLLTTLDIDSPVHEWVGYQIVFGLGTGFGFEQATLAAQAALSGSDVATGTALALFFQLFGGAIFVSVGNNVFTNQLISGIQAANIPDLDPQAIISQGATQLTDLVSAAELPAVVGAYMTALQHVFRVALIMSCLMLLGALGMKWVNVKKVGAANGSAASPSSSERK